MAGTLLLLSYWFQADGSSPEHEPSVQSQPSQPQQQSTSTSVSWFDQVTLTLHMHAHVGRDYGILPAVYTT